MNRSIEMGWFLQLRPEQFEGLAYVVASTLQTCQEDDIEPTIDNLSTMLQDAQVMMREKSGWNQRN